MVISLCFRLLLLLLFCFCYTFALWCLLTFSSTCSGCYRCAIWYNWWLLFLWSFLLFAIVLNLSSLPKNISTLFDCPCYMSEIKLSVCSLFFPSCFSENHFILARMFLSLFLAKDISPSSVNINKTSENLAIESHDTTSNRRFVAIQNKGLTASQSSPALHKEYYNSNEQIPTSGGDEDTYDDAISMGKKGFYVCSMANFCLHTFAFSFSIFKWPCSRSGTFMWYGNHVVLNRHWVPWIP